jgi:3-hydroxyisobutyrate dehydrogenase-like beta-hydroxyacid dehydrogenase
MAEHWCRLGWALHVFDLDPAKSQHLAALGAQVAGCQAEIFQACRSIVLSLPDDVVALRVWQENAAHAVPDTLVVDTSTGRPAGAYALAEAAALRGVAYVDATLSGSSAQVTSGQVLALCGGENDAVAQAREILAPFVANFIHAGPAGSGAALKLVTNLVLGLNRAALAEGLYFAEKLGVAPQLALDALQSSMAYSRIMDTKGQKMVQRDYSVQARLSQHLKDVRILLELAPQSALPLTKAHRHILETAENAGLGHLDNSALREAFQMLDNSATQR